MPGEVGSSTASGGVAAEDDAVKMNHWERFWNAQVLQRIKSGEKWADFKGKDISMVVQSMGALKRQCTLRVEQNRRVGISANRKQSIENLRDECILLLRLIELGPFFNKNCEDKHPAHAELLPADKKKIKADSVEAQERYLKVKEQLKGLVIEYYADLHQEQLRAATALADTKALGDALSGNGNRPIVNAAGDAMEREAFAQMSIPGSAIGSGCAKPTQMPLHPAPPQSSHQAGYGGGGAGMNGSGWASSRVVDNDDDVFIAVPADDADVPNLLPECNRMQWNTFVQNQRPLPGQVPHWRQAPSPHQHPRPYRGAGSAGGAVVAQPWTGGSHGALPRLGAGGTNSDVYDAQLQEALRQSALLAKREDEKTARLKERLATYTDFELEEVDNTGHCQFDAIAHQIFGRFPGQYDHLQGGSSYSYRQVRRDIANWLRQNAKVPLDNGETISDFHDEDDGATWEIFCDNVEDIRMSPGPLWGNHLTLIAAANCYQRPIRVWSTAPGDDWWLQIEPKHYKASSHQIRPFELAHLYERHYMSVTERKGPKRTMTTTPL